MDDTVLKRAASQLAAMPIVPLTWRPAVRVVPRFPPIEQLEGFGADVQPAVVAELATIDPLIIGDLRLLPPGPVPAGPGASHIVTSYTFGRPGRFNDETFAAFYGADSLATAIAETVHHIVQALVDGNAPAQTLPPRLVLHVDLEAAAVVDARTVDYPELYAPEEYGESQCFGVIVYERGHQGIVYRSVRRPAGDCVAVYTAAVLGACREDRELVYRYEDGRIDVSEIHFSGGI